HHLDVIAEADYVLDLGPEAGTKGGEIVAFGTPEQIARSPRSRTAPFLREVLKLQDQARSNLTEPISPYQNLELPLLPGPQPSLSLS
ncbi:MAG TPA: hypothetical protein VIT23_10330, partial [Terrimicrobiaceae bacterium]